MFLGFASIYTSYLDIWVYGDHTIQEEDLQQDVVMVSLVIIQESAKEKVDKTVKEANNCFLDRYE